MIAVESFRHGFPGRMCAKIIREHRRPRDGLENRPMRAEHRHKRNNQEKFSEADEHNNIFVKNLMTVNQKRCKDFQIVGTIREIVNLVDRWNNALRGLAESRLLLYFSDTRLNGKFRGQYF